MRPAGKSNHGDRAAAHPASAAGRRPRTPAPRAAPAHRHTWRATICSPIGSPAAVKPAGTLIAGCWREIERVAESRPVAPALAPLRIGMLDAGGERRQRRARGRPAGRNRRGTAASRHRARRARACGVLDLGPAEACALLGHGDEARDRAARAPRPATSRSAAPPPGTRCARRCCRGTGHRRVDPLDRGRPDRPARATAASNARPTSGSTSTSPTSRWPRSAARRCPPRGRPDSRRPSGGSACQSRRSGRLSTVSINAASSTVRVIGPICATVPNGDSGQAGTRPKVGLSPTTPQKLAGMRIEPPPSVPTCRHPCRAPPPRRHRRWSRRACARGSTGCGRCRPAGCRSPPSSRTRASSCCRAGPPPPRAAAPSPARPRPPAAGPRSCGCRGAWPSRASARGP